SARRVSVGRPSHPRRRAGDRHALPRGRGSSGARRAGAVPARRGHAVGPGRRAGLRARAHRPPRAPRRGGRTRAAVGGPPGRHAPRRVESPRRGTWTARPEPDSSPKGDPLMASLTQRMIGAAKLDAATYEEVEADTTATPQAMLVVVLASVAAGFGVLRVVGIGGLLIAALASLIGWYVWAFITYFVGTRFLPGPKTQADMGQLLRTIGFSA